MKTPIFIVSTLLFFASCTEAQKKPTKNMNLPIAPTKAGIGLIHFNPNNTILLYKSQHEKIPFDSIQFVIEKSGSDKERCNFVTTHLKSGLQPYILDQGDSDKDGQDHQQMGLIRFVPQLTFKVIDKLESGVVVLVNEKTNETSFIRLNAANDYRKESNEVSGFFDPNFPDTKIVDWYYFETWEQAIKRSFVINIPRGTLAYNKPDGNKVQVPDIESLLFKADTIKNNWVLITNKSFLGEGQKETSVWVKWKDNDAIKIHPVLNGGYE